MTLVDEVTELLEPAAFCVHTGISSGALEWQLSYILVEMGGPVNTTSK